MPKKDLYRILFPKQRKTLLCFGKQGLHQNLTESANMLNYQLAFEVIGFFRLTKAKANEIGDNVLHSVKNWRAVATKVGISRLEQTAKQDAFNV